MKVLLNALVLGRRPVGYTTVIREFLRAFKEEYGATEKNLALYVLIQRAALESIDPLRNLEKGGVIQFVVFPNFRTGFRVLLEQIATNFFALRLNCDLIHSPATLGIVFPLKPQVLFFQTSTTFMLPRTMHGRGVLATQLTNWIIRRSVASSTEVAVTTKTTGSELEKYIGSELPLTVIGNGVHDLSSIVIRGAAPAPVRAICDQPFVLYVSSFYRLKNQRLLIEAAPLLRGMRVVLAGAPIQSDYVEECVKLIEHLDAPVEIVGAIDDVTLAYLYRACTAYVCPSLFEGFALTPLEALQFNKPIVLARSSVLTEVYGTGFKYFSSDSVKELVNALESIDDEYVNFCTKNPILQKYNWHDFARLNFQLYRRIAGKPEMKAI